MSRWVDYGLADRLYMTSHVKKNIDQESVEKDWWVTTVLKAFFELSIAKISFFKGGTSLSKGWNIINRFSEDIDIALHRDFFLKVKGLECAQCINNNQIKMLRKASRDFVTGELKDELEKKLKELKLDVKVEAVTTRMTAEGEKPIDHDADPTVLLVYYPSIFNSGNQYVKPIVKIEISCLSMKEPYEVKYISSYISDEFKEDDNETMAEIATICPSRTFLEKAFLLNEEYQRNNPRTFRMSRHLYDLEKLMDTDYAKDALCDIALYSKIVEHRKKFYHVGGVDYSLNMPDKISFCPTGELANRFRSDYDSMKSSFIYETPLDFDKLIQRIEELQFRFRQIPI